MSIEANSVPSGEAPDFPTLVNATRFIPVTEWNRHHGWPTTSNLRHLISQSDRNGLAHAIARVGRRVLIDEQAFLAWVASHKERA